LGAAHRQRLKANCRVVPEHFATRATHGAGFDALLQTGYGSQIDTFQVASFCEQLRRGDERWMPRIEVVSSRALSDLSGQQGRGQAQGAYLQATDTI
jgi:hypothetical protein